MSFPDRPAVDPHGDRQPNAMQGMGLSTADEGQYIANSRPSLQKKPPDKTDQRSKKKRQQKPYRGEADQNDTDSDDNGTRKAAISRNSQHNGPPRQTFACPFAKYDPIRYHVCRPYEMSRIADILQHMRRWHILIENTHGNAQESRCVYCSQCRCEFHGRDAVKQLEDHFTACDARNQPATIEQTGVLLPQEFERLKSYVITVPGDTAKWETIWLYCFPSTATPWPYTDHVVSRQAARHILQHLLASPSADRWSPEEIKQSGIDKALDAIYSGQPLTGIEPQTNDASTISSTNLSSVSHDDESIFDNLDDGSTSIADDLADLHDLHIWTSPLKTAIFNVDYDQVHAILKNSFNEAATGEYSWLLELKALGLSTGEIADELLERSQYGPWIYSKIDVREVETFRPHFHVKECLHSDKEDESMSTRQSQRARSPIRFEADSDNSVRETIQYFCGIGGVTPMPDGSPNLQFGSVVFEDTNSTAIVSLMNSQFFQVVPNVMVYLSKAISTLQQVGGCCDSFTFLARQADLVELQRVEPSGASGLEALTSSTSSQASLRDLDPQLLSSLTAQFLSLGFALYAQGHCEPFRPFFLDNDLNHILLIGNQIWGPSFTGPCILASAVELSCFGEMTQRRVFAFQYFEAFERSMVFSDSDKKFDLKAYPEDLLDTWGPGDFIIPKEDPENLHAIHIGGGLIIPTPVENNQAPILHWKRLSLSNTLFVSTFPRNDKLVIGLRVSINHACTLDRQWLKMSLTSLKELGTYPGFWEVYERQVGVGGQAGQSVVGILSFNQTWVKRPGQTKKSKILASRSLFLEDLEGYFAVQVSFCTGIARRVRLRELLADVLSIYVAGLAIEPHRWNDLEQNHIEQILRDNNFGIRLRQLDRELQKEFVTLAYGALFLLQDTGIDGENFVVSCVSTGLSTKCVKIPLERESFWAKILADSDEVATFAYMAPTCFQTSADSCRGGTGPWRDITTLFSTTMSLCQDQSVQQGTVAPIINWTLQDAEEYHIGRSDQPFRVRVLRPTAQDQPKLLISMSQIERPILNSWILKMRNNVRWRRRLRESRAIDHEYGVAENVVIGTDLRALR